MLELTLIGITIILLLFLFSMVWPPDSPWSPWWRTSKKIARIMCRLAKVTETDYIYDLGSGEGRALIIAAKEYGASGVGVEIDPLRYWFSKLAVKFYGLSYKIIIERENFFDVDTSSATVIFMYLIPKTLARLKQKLLKELKPGTRVVSFAYKMDLPLIASDEVNEVYVYEIPEAKN